MGITGLLPFIEKASRRTNVNEFNGCTVAIDSYCWLHKGAFACADKLVRGEETDIHIKYCLKYVTMLLSKNIKPILVFDGRHLPAKAMTESKRRESRDISKKRAAELLSLGKIEEARSYIRRSVDITHEMALSLIQECRKRNVDCIVAPYEADAQLAYLNIKGIAHLVITEDSDLILFGCTKVLFKMDLEGTGTLVETVKLPLAMKCPIEQYTFDKFRQMCIMSGCDYLASLPGIGLAKARQFVTATQDSNFANALKKLSSFFNRSTLTVTDEYRENFLKAEATFKHQYVYDPLERSMVRLTEPDDEDIEKALCVNAGELLEAKTAFQLALGNLDPFSLRKMDDWHPDKHSIHAQNNHVRTNGWKQKGVSNHPSIWSPDFKQYLMDPCPWQKKTKKLESIIAQSNTRPRKKVVNLVTKYVPETQDESISIESLSNMYCVEQSPKRQKVDCELKHTKLNNTLTECEANEIKKEAKSPILENKGRSYKKGLLKRLSRFPRTIVDHNIVESKFFSTSNSLNEENNVSKDSITIEESPEKCSRNPFKVSRSSGENDCNESKHDLERNPSKVSKSCEDSDLNVNKSFDCHRNPFKVSRILIENEFGSEKNSNCNANDETIVIDCDENNVDMSVEELEGSQKENSPYSSPVKKPNSPILEPSPRHRNLFRRFDANFDKSLSEDSVIENTYPMETLVTPVDSQESFGQSPPKPTFRSSSQPFGSPGNRNNGLKKSNCRVPGLKKTTPLPNNQPTLLSMFGFQKKPVLKR